MTTIADVVKQKEHFQDYVIKRTSQLSALLNSGIMERNDEYDNLASQPAQVHNMPFFVDLSGEPENVIEGGKLTAKKINSKLDSSTHFRRAQMWSATDLSASLSGADPIKAIGDLISSYWARVLQAELINILDGVFESDEMKESHVLDLKNQKITGKAIIDATQKLGDAKNQLTGIIMHSATHAELMKQNLIERIQPSENVDFATFQGKRVIVDDSCPVESDGVYTTYLFGPGAIAFGEGNPNGHVAFETDREKRMGSGIDYLISRKVWLIHPRGVAWQNAVRANAETVSREELKNKTNWKKVYEDKQIRMVKFMHKL